MRLKDAEGLTPFERFRADYLRQKELVALMGQVWKRITVESDEEEIDELMRDGK